MASTLDFFFFLITKESLVKKMSGSNSERRRRELGALGLKQRRRRAEGEFGARDEEKEKPLGYLGFPCAKWAFWEQMQLVTVIERIG